MEIRSQWARTSQATRTGDKTSCVLDRGDALEQIIGRFDSTMDWDERCLIRYEITGIDPRITIEFGVFPDGITDPEGRRFEGWGAMALRYPAEMKARRFIKRVHERGNALHKMRRHGAPVIYSTISRRLWIISDTLAIHNGWAPPREW